MNSSTIKTKSKCNLDLVGSIGINIFVLFLSMLIFRFRYENYDDIVMMNYAAAGSEFVVYQNIFCGYFYKFLFSLTDAVNWYSIVFYLFAFVSSNILSYLMLKNIKEKVVAYLVVIAFAFTFSADIYSQMQFTKLAGLMITAGMMLVYCSQENKLKITSILCGVMLILIGSLLRQKIVLSCLPGICILCLFTAVKIYENKNDKKKVVLGTIVIACLGIAFFMTFGLKAVGNDIVSKNQNFVDYLNFDKYRSDLYDHGYIEYSEIEEELEKLNFSENDYKMLKAQDIADPNFFTKEKMQAIKEITPESTLPVFQRARNPLYEISNISGYIVFWGCVFLICIACMLYYSKKEICALLIITGGVAALYLYI